MSRKNDRGTSHPLAPPAEDSLAAEKLFPEVYAELRRIAASQLRDERRNATIEPTVLVHECFLKLSSQPSPSWRSRTHFCAIAARAMRQLLVDHARTKSRLKRGAGAARITLSEADAPRPSTRDVDVVDLERALRKLGEFDLREARMVELRFFGGLTDDEIALEVGVSRRTVQQDWAHARAWLRRELAPGGEP